MADDLMNVVRAKMLLDDRFVFFGSLAMNLKPVASEAVDTLRTDGSKLWYNPKFLAGLPGATQLAACAHEVLHPALGHCWRRGERDPFMANVAADYVVNDILVQSGLTLTKDWLHDTQYRGMSFEQVYSKLVANQAQGKAGAGQGGTGQPGGKNVAGQAPGAATGNSPGPGQGQKQDGVPQGPMGNSPTGDFVDAPPEGQGGEDPGMTESDWQLAVEQAVKVAQAAGCMPGGMAGAIVKMREPRVDWVAELKAFMARVLPSDYSWARPNRRFICEGLYLPGITKDGVGEIVLGIDTSGSTMNMQEQFAGEFRGVLQDARPERTHIVYWDAVVQATEEVTADDFEIAYQPKGFGGTTPRVMFDWVKEQGIEPRACVIMTDLEFYGAFPEDPGYPVLFVAPDYCVKPVPFGQVIGIPKED